MFANVVCKWVSWRWDWYLPRMFSGLVYGGAGVLMYALCLFDGRSVVQVLLGVAGVRVPVMGRLV